MKYYNASCPPIVNEMTQSRNPLFGYTLVNLLKISKSFLYKLWYFQANPHSFQLKYGHYCLM